MLKDQQGWTRNKYRNSPPITTFIQNIHRGNSAYCPCKGLHHMKCVPPLPSSFFPPLTAVVTADVTKVGVKNYWGPIECVVTLIVSQQCDWKGSHEAAEAIIPPHLWPVPQVTMCVCAGRVEGAATAVCPPSVYPHFKHTLTKRKHQMLAWQYKDTHGCVHTNTCTQTGTSHSRGQTAWHTLVNTVKPCRCSVNSKVWSLSSCIDTDMSAWIHVANLCVYMLKAIWGHLCAEEWCV